MKKMKYLTGVLIFSLVMSIAQPAGAVAGFKDVPNNHQFIHYISHLVEIGAINGYKDGTFKPDRNVTRGQAAKIITMALNMPLKNPSTPTFKDIPRHHDYYKHIETLVAHGVINGYADGTFKAQNTLKRSHMAKIISNSMRLTKQSNSRFKDVPVKDEFYPYIDKLAAIEITTGYPDGTFKPNNNVTRGQMAAFISRGLNNWLSSDEFFFDRGLNLGMTQEQVIDIEGRPTHYDENSLEYEWVAHSEFGANLLLYFTNNKLDHIITYLNIAGIEMGDTEEYFQQIVAFIYNPVFGEPIDYEYKWKNQGGNETLHAEWNIRKGENIKIEMSTTPGRTEFYFTTIVYTNY